MVESGHRIRCLVRRPAEGLRGRGVEVVMGDVTDPESLKTAMSGVEAVVHLVGILRESRGASFSGVNVQGTRNVLQAAQGSGVKRFIHIGVLGASPDPRYGYFYSKWLGEEAVRSSRLDFTILSPAGYVWRRRRLYQPASPLPQDVPPPGANSRPGEEPLSAHLGGGCSNLYS